MQLSNFRPKISFLCYTLLEIVIFMIIFFSQFMSQFYASISTLFCILEDAYTFVKNTCTYWQRYFKKILQRRTLSYFDWHNRKKLPRNFAEYFRNVGATPDFIPHFYISRKYLVLRTTCNALMYSFFITLGAFHILQSIHSYILNCHVPLVDRYWSRTSIDASVRYNASGHNSCYKN